MKNMGRRRRRRRRIWDESRLMDWRQHEVLGKRKV
jgi:hypothetical protein